MGVDFDEVLEVFSELLGVRPTIIKPREEIAEEEQEQNMQQGMAAGVQTLETASKAGLNIAKMNQLSQGRGSV